MGLPSARLICFLLFATLNLFSVQAFSVPGWTAFKNDPSVVKITDGFGSCTGTRVSNDGYILTARHCFNTCLISKGFVDKRVIYPAEGWQSPVLYLFPNKKTAYCLVELDGIKQEIEIVAASDGFMIPSQQASLSVYDMPKYLEYLNNNFLYNGDFAVIRTQKNNFDQASCRKVSRGLAGTQGGAVKVYYLGYPSSSTGRPKGANSNGVSLLMGEGVTISSILKNACLGEKPNKDSLKLRYDRTELLLSTVDVLPGASGAALLNEEGEIVGVINSVYQRGKDMYSEYCSGSAISLNINYVVNKIKNNLGENKVEQIFNCNNN